MRAVTVDPVLLAPDGAGLPARSVAEDLAGEAAVVRFEGPPRSWRKLARLPPGQREQVRDFLRQLVALSIAVAPSASGVAGDCDMWTDDPAKADEWCSGFERAPLAILAAALLSRRRGDDTWDGLVAESATYSLLQAAPEFARWSEGRRGTAAPPGRGGSDQARVALARREGCWEVVLTRPERHNAIDSAMRDELHAALCEPRLDPASAIVVRAEGPSFSSGGDLSEFATFPDVARSHAIRLSRSLALDFAELGGRMVVGLHGSCLGAGLELACFASHVVAADDAELGLPEASLGLLPGAGGTVSVRRRAGAGRLLQLLVESRPVDAGTARRWGLVDEVVPRARLRETLAERAGEVTSALRFKQPREVAAPGAMGTHGRGAG